MVFSLLLLMQVSSVHAAGVLGPLPDLFSTEPRSTTARRNIFGPYPDYLGPGLFGPLPDLFSLRTPSRRSSSHTLFGPAPDFTGSIGPVPNYLTAGMLGPVPDYLPFSGLRTRRNR
ncbi:hypothetical protein A2881_00090 [Candidatus Peribacteria bacterium RIFCSPHIGHO2_01_FULL_55_13]|nr:MAG: hypothetical protein A2881_00090 [Candidatus Peribacteria bacterium RIFCSPHIGHO2_01_FULL_55_13]OGJ66258.1 MAG: hypothetical protein A3F36_01835 [Candidatus Peribacteria bacterium RIFCSPHIGHO2_12_FULL_55_11]